MDDIGGRLPATVPVPQPVSQEAVIDSLMAALHSQPGEGSGGLDTLRMQMFGRYYEELEGRMKELRAVVDGGIARTRRALMERVDELGGALHRDMVALRSETHKEIEDLKRDVFSAVMNLSALNDKVGMADSRFRESYIALANALTERLDQQSGNLRASLEAIRQYTDTALQERVKAEVSTALQASPPAMTAAQSYGQPITTGFDQAAFHSSAALFDSPPHA